jgi:hypothetical protein
VIENDWLCIAGVHFQPEGGAAAVWVAHDKKADVLHLWDCAVYRREPLVIIAEGLNRHGRWVPIAWEASARELVEKLLDRGCNTLAEPTKETPVMADAVSRDIAERMRSGRFKVDKRLAEWLDEFGSFKWVDGKVPLNTHPLMSATRHAIAGLEYARRQRGRGDKSMKNYPAVTMI